MAQTTESAPPRLAADRGAGAARGLRARARTAAAAAAPGEPRRVAYLYVAPALAAFAAFALFPMVHSFWLSFFDWDGVTQATWVGLDNYESIMTDGAVRAAFEHAFVLVAFYTVIPIILGLVLAACIGRARVRGTTAFRTLLFVPQIIPAVVVAVVWRMIYIPDEGTLNETLRAVGLGALANSWLGDFTLALPSIGMVGAWVEFGLCMVLFIAGLQKIPANLYEAARIDGAGPIREFFLVTLPGLRNELVVAVVLTVTGALRTFDLVFLTTRGGPGTATTVPAFLVYDLAFRKNQVGAAAAIGVVLAVVIFALSWLVIRLGERGRP